MPVKYVCPKCGRRFAEWGAEKFGFKCPGDQYCPPDRPDDIELVRVGAQEDRPTAKKPTLKRPTKRVPIAPSSMNEDEILVPDIEDIEAETDVDDDGIDEIESEDEEAVESEAEGEETNETISEGEVEDEDAVDEGDADIEETLEDAEDIVEDDWKQ